MNNPPSGKKFTYIFEVAVAASDTPILNELTATGYTINLYASGSNSSYISSKQYLTDKNDCKIQKIDSEINS